MSLRKYFLIAIGGAVLGAATGFAWRAIDGTQQPPIASPFEDVALVDELPPFSFVDLDGQTFDSTQISDKVIVVNFWATWCPPCRKETPDFVALQAAYRDHVQFVGIAIDDSEPVREFAESFAMNYPVLLGDTEAVKLSKSLGNRHEGLPFTVVVDGRGKIMMRHAGGIDRDKLENKLKVALQRG